jgi:muramoyltetrapeptide carboxypeptidase
MLIRPRHLSPGDTVGIIAPASAPPDPQATDRGVAVLEQLGFRVQLAPNVRQRLGYLAGNDRDRARDLMGMFTDRKVNAVLCVRGGYGTARLLPRLDFDVIRAHPKILVGYSDITSLHCALLAKANLISFHGPMLNSDFSQPNMPDFTLQSFLRTLGCSRLRHAGRTTAGISNGYSENSVKTLRRGVASGRLIGGNLTLLCTTIGTPWQPSFKGRILFFEDVGEPPYRFDRMLTYLLHCGLLQQVSGIAVGLNADCQDARAKVAVKPGGSHVAKQVTEYRQTLVDVLKERLLPLKIPVVTGLPFGHTPHNATLPVGARAVLDGNNGELLLAESAVR